MEADMRGLQDGLCRKRAPGIVRHRIRIARRRVQTIRNRGVQSRDNLTHSRSAACVGKQGTGEQPFGKQLGRLPPVSGPGTPDLLFERTYLTGIRHAGNQVSRRRLREWLAVRQPALAIPNTTYIGCVERQRTGKRAVRSARHTHNEIEPIRKPLHYRTSSAWIRWIHLWHRLCQENGTVNCRGIAT